MRKSVIHLLLILISFMFMNCEEEVPVPDELKSSPKLVLYSELEEDKNYILFTLTQSIPLFNSNSSEPINIDIAKVILWTNNNAFETTNIYPDLNNDQYYSRKYFKFDLTENLKAGNTYKLEIYTKNNQVISGETTIPKMEISDAALDINEQTENSSPTYQLSFFDPQGETNYYLTAYRDNNNLYSNLSINNEPFNDNNFDGKKLKSPAANFYRNNSYGAPSPLNNFDFYIKTIDIHHYKLMNSLFNYSGNNPFSEPQNIYSNVSGGLGCVYSSNIKEVTIK